MIEQVIVMNLERRTDKWWFALGEFHAMNFSLYGEKSLWGNTIIRYLSHDGSEYPDSKAVCQAAIKDGFPTFESAVDIVNPNWVAWLWTWVSALRTIIEKDKIILLAIDDFVPCWSWLRLDSLVTACVDLRGHGDFRGLQLRGNTEDSTDYEEDPIHPLLQRGFVGNDNALVLNGEGAQLVMDHFLEPPLALPDAKLGDFGELGRTCEAHYKGFWHLWYEMPAFRLGFYNWKTNLGSPYSKLQWDGDKII